MKRFLKIALALVVLIVVPGVIVSVNHARANTSRYVQSTACTTSGSYATTTSYMRPGLATTTVTCNLEYLASLSYGSASVDSAVLMVQTLASSSQSTIYNMTYSYSTNGYDWYVDKYSNATTSFAQVATSTAVGSASLARTAYSLPVPTRWVKVDIALAIGSNNGGVFAQIAGKAERIDN